MLSTVTDWTAIQLQTAREIVAIDHKYGDVPPLLHLAVCIQESSLIPNAVGDNGQSYGPHQLYQIAHPGTAFLAVNPWYDYGYPEVRNRWQSAYAQIGGDVAWNIVANRGSLIEQFAPLAQGSVNWTPGLGATRYAEAVEILEIIS